MARTNRLTIPLEENERKAIDWLAKQERLPTATAARRILLDAAHAVKGTRIDRLWPPATTTSARR